MPRPSPQRLDLERVRARLSAYVYGNLLLLAAVVQVDPATLDTATPVVTVVATMVTTYVAHVVAQLVGHGIRRTPEEHDALTSAELRDATPILSAGVPPSLLFGAAALGWLDRLDPAAVVLVAVLFVTARLAFTGWAAGHFDPGRSRASVFWSGIALAVTGLVIAVAKLVLLH